MSRDQILLIVLVVLLSSTFFYIGWTRKKSSSLEEGTWKVYSGNDYKIVTVNS